MSSLFVGGGGMFPIIQTNYKFISFICIYDTIWFGGGGVYGLLCQVEMSFICQFLYQEIYGSIRK